MPSVDEVNERLSQAALANEDVDMEQDQSVPAANSAKGSTRSETGKASKRARSPDEQRWLYINPDPSLKPTIAKILDRLFPRAKPGTLPKEVKEGSYGGIVKELKQARTTPGERLKLLREWDSLRKKELESVNDFCYRMERLSSKIHGEADRDFLLGSKLYQCLADWKDAYHMLAELDRADGQVYQAVRKAALRLERTQQPRQVEHTGAREVYRKDKRVQPRSDTMEQHANTRGGMGEKKSKCYSCGEEGHFARKCPKSAVRPQGRKQPGLSRDTGEGRRGAFSTFVKDWCCGIRTPEMTAAYGKPYIYDIEIFGILAKAMIDTGSVISIVPMGLLKRAQREGADLDKSVTVMNPTDNRPILDASGNAMSFLKLIATNVRIQEAQWARVQLHVQDSPETLVLMGANALKALGIDVTLTRRGEYKDESIASDTAAKVAKRCIIPPGAARTLLLSCQTKEGEQILNSSDERIASGVCRISDNVASVSVRNRGSEPSRRSVRTDFSTIDYRCPGAYELGEQSTPCHSVVQWSKIVDNPPLPDLMFKSIFELARAVTILRQTHVPAEWRAATIVDQSYITLSASSLGFAISFFRANCLYLAAYCRQSLVSSSSSERLPHPPRRTEDPFELASLVAEAQQWSYAHPWKQGLWRELPILKTLILLPSGFQEHVQNISSARQVAYAYTTPKEIRAEWLAGEWSAVILFSSTYYAPVLSWQPIWERIMGAVAR
ncbi:hypothetical protein GCK32_010167, partial [Trichostrongylus colubriformis]